MPYALKKGPHGLRDIDLYPQLTRRLHPGRCEATRHKNLNGANVIRVAWVAEAAPKVRIADAILDLEHHEADAIAASEWLLNFTLVYLANVLPPQVDLQTQGVESAS